MRIVNEVRVQVSQECSHFLRRVETFARSGEGDITVTLPDGAGADLDSNSETVESEGVALTKVGAKEDRHRYKLGGGGTSFKIDSEGGIRFRSANTLVSKL